MWDLKRDYSHIFFQPETGTTVGYATFPAATLPKHDGYTVVTRQVGVADGTGATGVHEVCAQSEQRHLQSNVSVIWNRIDYVNVV